jgi:hypothetical protein
MVNLITLAGRGQRFVDKGYELPKPLLRVNDNYMVCEAVDCLPVPDRYVFVCLEEHRKKYNIDIMLTDRYPNSELVFMEGVTEGQAMTAELGILQSSIRPEESLLISCCDYGLRWDENKYDELLESDIVVWTTIHNKAFSDDPDSYSWLDVDETGNLLKTYVKQKIFEDSYNERAIVGTFYFKRAKYFLEGLTRIYENNIRSNGEFYIDNIFNTLTDLDIKVFDVDEYRCWGTPKEFYEDQILG